LAIRAFSSRRHWVRSCRLAFPGEREGASLVDPLSECERDNRGTTAASRSSGRKSNVQHATRGHLTRGSRRRRGPQRPRRDPLSPRSIPLPKGARFGLSISHFEARQALFYPACNKPLTRLVPLGPGEEQRRPPQGHPYTIFPPSARARDLMGGAFVSGYRRELNFKSRARRGCRGDGLGTTGARRPPTLSVRLLGHRRARQRSYAGSPLACRGVRPAYVERRGVRLGLRRRPPQDSGRAAAPRGRDGSRGARRPVSALLLHRPLPPGSRRRGRASTTDEQARVRAGDGTPRALRFRSRAARQGRRAARRGLARKPASTSRGIASVSVTGLDVPASPGRGALAASLPRGGRGGHDRRVGPCRLLPRGPCGQQLPGGVTGPPGHDQKGD
jgi:hypothetical protein